VFIGTTFDSGINYGNDIQYQCRYGYNSTNEFITNTTVKSGVFQCSLYFTIEGKGILEIWIKGKNSEKRLSLTSEQINIVSKRNFKN
jgi:hypothetical protein